MSNHVSGVDIKDPMPYLPGHVRAHRILTQQPQEGHPDRVYGEIYRTIGFDKALHGALRKRATMKHLFHLVMARIANPASKRRTVADLAENFGVQLSLPAIYRSMDQIDDKSIERIIFVADSALLSKENSAYLEKANIEYIVGARLNQQTRSFHSARLPLVAQTRSRAHRHLFHGAGMRPAPDASLPDSIRAAFGRGHSPGSRCDPALLDAEPEVQAELFHTLGSLYHRLGDLATADSLLRRALDQRRMILGPEHPDVAASLLGPGLLRTDQAELDEAESLIDESLELSRRRHPAGHSAVARGMTALGTVLQQRGDYDEAIALLEEAVQMQSSRGAPNDGLSSTMSELANTHYYAGDFAASDSLNRIVLEMNRRLYGERHPLIGDDLINLGAIQFEAGRFEEAEQLYRQALEIFEAYYGPDHPQTASNLTVIGRALVQQNRVDEALELLERALEVRERVFGPDHPRVASTLNEIGLVALSHGDYDLAREIFLRMQDLYRSIYGDEHYLVGIARANYASAYLDAGDFAHAESLFRDVLDIYDETLPEDHINIAIAEVKLGRAILRQQRYQDAEPHTAAAHRILTARAQPAAGWIRAARRDLLEIYEALGNTEGAMQMEEELAAMETAAQP